jgi:hypothetical protein
VPPLYARMAGEFEDLVRGSGYAAWVATHPKPALVAGGRAWVASSAASGRAGTGIPM